MAVVTPMWQRRALIPMAHLALAASLAGAAVLAMVVPPAFAKPEPKTSVADLRYGVTLFHYYQQDYLSALTELMIADTRDGIQGHGDNPELFVAGISLAFGMENRAEQLFYQLLQDPDRPQKVRDAAWFQVGKLHYTRGSWNDAEQSFARVSAAVNPKYHAEMQALRINLQIRRDQIVPIPLKQLNQKELGDWSPYALYNMGAAHARAGNFTQARAYYRAATKTDIPKSPRAKREYWALQDKVFTALGYSYLLEKNYPAAMREFKQVRLNSPLAHPALLGYGWAAFEQEKYTEALRPWQSLRQRSLLHSEVQESLLAVGYAYEKLGAVGDALGAYETAEQRLAVELERLSEMRATLTQGELMTLIGSPPQSDDVLRKPADDPTTVTAIVADDGANWLKLDKISIVKTRSAYLSELFAQNEFQTAVLDLRDLLRLRRLLADAQPKLAIYADLLREKQAQRHETEQKLARQVLGEQLSQLRTEYSRLSEQLTQIAAAEDYMALADDNSRDLYRLVERSQRTLDRLRQAGEDTREQQASLNLYRGILLWNAAQEFPDRLWQGEKRRLVSEAVLQELGETEQRIQALTSTHMDIQPMLARIAQMRTDTAFHLAQIDALLAARGAALREQVDAHLEQQQKRLNTYLAQAHLAVARLYDTALRNQTP